MKSGEWGFPVDEVSCAARNVTDPEWIASGGVGDNAEKTDSRGRNQIGKISAAGQPLGYPDFRRFEEAPQPFA
jgi:hypothetical protein